MSSVHRCPVCYGKGIVPNGFYSSTSNTWTSSSIMCRSCGGRGVITVYDQTPSSPYLSADDLQKIVDGAERGGVKR
jgi:DnaJ-class molecular chaperone